MTVTVRGAIARGAHTTEEECRSGTDDADRRDPNVPLLCDPDDGPAGNFVWQPEPPLEVPAANDGIQIYAPRRDVAPGTQWETCLAVKLDCVAAEDVSGLPDRADRPRPVRRGHHHLLYDAVRRGAGNDATKTCSVDSDCDMVADPPRVFAEGDPMPLVFGLLADDDMCNMFGYFINAGDLANLP